MESAKRFGVVISGGSRSGRDSAYEVCKVLGDTAAFVEVTKSSQDQQRIIRKAIESGIREIWVGGGDGTIRAAAQQLSGTDVLLRILPLGTGNSLARELEIPIPLKEASEFPHTKAIQRKIDVGRLNDQSFVNVATLGLTTKIMEQVQDSNKGALGRMVYLPAVARAVSNLKSIKLELEVAGGGFDGPALQFVAAATRLHGGPFPVSEHAAIDDGKLSIYIVSQAGKGSLLRYGVALLLGKQTELGEVWNCETDRATVRLRSPQKFVIDGDPYRTKTAQLGIEKWALNVSAAPKEEK